MNVVHVIGLGRSGTTITHLMLGNAENAFACGEIYAKFRPWRTHHFHPKCPCGKAYEHCIWRQFDGDTEADFHNNLATKLGRQWVIDESKPLRWVVDSQRWAEKTGMNIFNIVMMKEPINQLHSFWKRGASANHYEKRYISYYGRLIDLGIPFVTVSFEQLAKDPANKLRCICDLIGMDYFEGKERFWERKHCHLFGSLGVRKQMQRGGMEIRHEQEYSEEFLGAVKPDLDKIISNQNFQAINRNLVEREVDRVSEYIGTPAPFRSTKPVWYYLDWLVGQKRRLLPHKWEHDF